MLGRERQMDWFKCSTRLYQNPKVMLAGEDGVLLYLQLLGLNAQEDLDGLLTGPRARPEFLSRLMSLLSREWDEARVTAALEALEVAGMIGLGEEGEIAILGWDDSWRPAKSSKERQREFRARKKGDGDAVTQRDDADVTQRNGASVTPSREERYARNGAAVTPSRTQRDTVTPRGEREERGERREREELPAPPLSLVDVTVLTVRNPTPTTVRGASRARARGPARPPHPPRGKTGRSVDVRARQS
jgi:thioesterase domain-containing protein